MVTPGISAALMLMALGANVAGASVPWDAASQAPLELPSIDLTNISSGEVSARAPARRSTFMHMRISLK
jgi:hypothetical protein